MAVKGKHKWTHCIIQYTETCHFELGCLILCNVSDLWHVLVFSAWALERGGFVHYGKTLPCWLLTCYHFLPFCPSGTERHHIWIEKNCIWCRVWQQHHPWQWNRKTQSHVYQGLQDAGIHCMHLGGGGVRGRNRNSCLLHHVSISWLLETQLNSDFQDRWLWTFCLDKCKGSLGTSSEDTYSWRTQNRPLF